MNFSTVGLYVHAYTEALAGNQSTSIARVYAKLDVSFHISLWVVNPFYAVFICFMVHSTVKLEGDAVVSILQSVPGTEDSGKSRGFSFGNLKCHMKSGEELMRFTRLRKLPQRTKHRKLKKLQDSQGPTRSHISSK
ncbi:hypothetical protein STEG23_037035 [Scotinomys teguina]